MIFFEVKSLLPIQFLVGKEETPWSSVKNGVCLYMPLLAPTMPMVQFAKGDQLTLIAKYIDISVLGYKCTTDYGP